MPCFHWAPFLQSQHSFPEHTVRNIARTICCVSESSPLTPHSCHSYEQCRTSRVDDLQTELSQLRMELSEVKELSLFRPVRPIPQTPVMPTPRVNSRSTQWMTTRSPLTHDCDRCTVATLVVMEVAVTKVKVICVLMTFYLAEGHIQALRFPWINVDYCQVSC